MVTYVQLLCTGQSDTSFGGHAVIQSSDVLQCDRSTRGKDVCSGHKQPGTRLMSIPLQQQYSQRTSR